MVFIDVSCLGLVENCRLLSIGCILSEINHSLSYLLCVPGNHSRYLGAGISSQSHLSAGIISQSHSSAGIISLTHAGAVLGSGPTTVTPCTLCTYTFIISHFPRQQQHPLRPPPHLHMRINVGRLITTSSLSPLLALLDGCVLSPLSLVSSFVALPYPCADR